MIAASGWWQRSVVEPGKVPLLFCFVAFVATFLVTRLITRSIRAGRGPFRDNAVGGVHVHHAVPGIILLVLGAFLAIGASPHAPWRELAAVSIGVGSSLVLDEFALILHLEDVYWQQEGQVSVQAVALVVACLACPLLGLNPFGVDDASAAEVGVRTAATVALLASMVAVVVMAAKGKYRLALLAVFVPVLAYASAFRLARPGSWWDRHRYDTQPERRQRATERAARNDARWDPRFRRLADLIAGTPDADPTAPA